MNARAEQLAHECGIIIETDSALRTSVYCVGTRFHVWDGGPGRISPYDLWVLYDRHARGMTEPALAAML